MFVSRLLGLVYAAGRKEEEKEIKKALHMRGCGFGVPLNTIDDPTRKQSCTPVLNDSNHALLPFYTKAVMRSRFTRQQSCAPIFAGI